MDREADTGGILGQTMDVLARAGREVALYVLFLGLVGGIGGLLGLVDIDGEIFSARLAGGEWSTTDYADATTAMLAGLFGIAHAILYVIASYWLLRRMLPGIGRQLAEGSSFVAYLLMSILAFLGMMLGFVLLIIPGLIVLVRWSAANGMLLSRGCGITESLGESWDATKGHGFSVFLAGLVLSIAIAILTAIVAAPFALFLTQSAVLEAGSMSLATGIAVALQSFGDAFGNSVMLALSIAVFHLVSPADEGVAEVFE